jgi:peptidylprolyl isomerase
VPIASIRLVSDLPANRRPSFQYLDTSSPAFAAYVHARANRRDAFFIRPAGGVDVCNAPVPIRRTPIP